MAPNRHSSRMNRAPGVWFDHWDRCSDRPLSRFGKTFTSAKGRWREAAPFRDTSVFTLLWQRHFFRQTLDAILNIGRDIPSMHLGAHPHWSVLHCPCRGL